MDASMNDNWVSFESLNLDLDLDQAIRRFCPARLEHGGDAWKYELEDEELSLTLHGTNNPWYPPHSHNNHPSSSDEEDHFVNSFFNMEDSYSEKEESSTYDLHHQQQQQPSDLFWNGVHVDDQNDSFPMMPSNDDDVYENIPLMMIEGDDVEMNSIWCEEDEVVTRHEGGVVEEQGLHLVHLLLACAEALACRHTQLAHSILTQIWSCCSNPWPSGDSIQRLSHCFAMGFTSRLSLHNLNSNNGNGGGGGGAFPNLSYLTTNKDKTEALHLLHQITPYHSFGFMAANDAIFEAAQGKNHLHIVDLGMQHTFQWPPLITRLASRTEGPPKLVRITGVVENNNQDMLDELESSMKAIAGQATSLGILIEFHIIAGPATTSFLTRQHLDLREVEALFVNSILHLHTYVKESRGSLKTILQAIKKLEPTLLTVVEQDANHNGPFFLGRFLESLHYYSAIFDSLEASLPRNSNERMKIEKLYFAEEIQNIVGYEGTDRIERHERADQWRRHLGRAGLQMVGLKASQAKTVLQGEYGYTLTSDMGCLLLGWKGRPIMLASAWKVPPNHNA